MKRSHSKEWHHGSGLDLQDTLGSELIWVRVGGFCIVWEMPVTGAKGKTVIPQYVQ